MVSVALWAGEMSKFFNHLSKGVLAMDWADFCSARCFHCLELIIGRLDQNVEEGLLLRLISARPSGVVAEPDDVAGVAVVESKGDSPSCCFNLATSAWRVVIWCWDSGSVPRTGSQF